MQPFQNAAVAQVFDSYPTPVRSKLMALRDLIFDTAAKTLGVGALEETLKWSEPAYLTTHTKSGSTVRIAWKATRPLSYVIYFNCHTTLVETFRTLFPNDFEFEGNRAIIFAVAGRLPKRELAWCIAAALTYHRKSSGAA